MANGQGGLSEACFDRCCCDKGSKAHRLCRGQHGFDENGKEVSLKPRRSETCEAFVLDGCVFADNDPDPRCDGAFLWRGKARKALVLVELKGANHLEKAVEQLAYVRYQRPEYAKLRDRLRDSDRERIQEKAFIITNGSMTKPLREKLENHYAIRVSEVIQTEPTQPKPDLRDWLNG